MKRSDPQAAEQAVKARCESDRLLFAKVFFGDKLEYPFSPFHVAGLTIPKMKFRERPPMGGRKRAREGPRGNGKTTIYIRVEIVHDIVYEFEEYIVILAASAQLSWARVREIALELQLNKAIRHFFGDLKGDVWRVGMGEFQTANGVTVLGKSRKSQVRGLLHPVTNARPTKIILDDFEDSEEVQNPELREKDARFVKEDVEGAASVDGRTNFQATGTPLHREAWLPTLERNPGWEFQKYPAVRKWPERMDLWERCRAVFAAAGASDPGDDEPPSAHPAAVDVAWRFYQAHRREMDRGAEVLWPEGEPLFALMVFRWTNGEASFSKEKQLVPRDPSLATFEMESEEYPVRGAIRHTLTKDAHGELIRVDTRDGKTRPVHLHRLRIVTAHDPAKADPSRKATRTSLGDYACITVMGFEYVPGGGRFGHILDAWIERAPPSVQVAMHFELAERWKAAVSILEEDTLALLRGVYRDEARRRKASHRYYQLPLRAITHQDMKKPVRIATMEPAVVNAWLTYNRSLPPTYWNQWVDHPTGDHDDGPDSAEMCWRRGGRKQAGLRVVNLAA